MITGCIALSNLVYDGFVFVSVFVVFESSVVVSDLVSVLVVVLESSVVVSDWGSVLSKVLPQALNINESDFNETCDQIIKFWEYIITLNN